MLVAESPRALRRARSSRSCARASAAVVRARGARRSGVRMRHCRPTCSSFVSDVDRGAQAGGRRQGDGRRPEGRRRLAARRDRGAQVSERRWRQARRSDASARCPRCADRGARAVSCAPSTVPTDGGRDRRRGCSHSERGRRARSRTMPVPPSAPAEYRDGIDLLRRGDNGGAIQKLREFLRKSPKSDLADDAQYWIGEAYYANRDYNRAILEFNEVLLRYPKGDKVPAALLRQAMAFAELGRQGRRAPGAAEARERARRIRRKPRRDVRSSPSSAPEAGQARPRASCKSFDTSRRLAPRLRIPGRHARQLRRRPRRPPRDSSDASCARRPSVMGTAWYHVLPAPHGGAAPGARAGVADAVCASGSQGFVTRASPRSSCSASRARSPRSKPTSSSSGISCDASVSSR